MGPASAQTQIIAFGDIAMPVVEPRTTTVVQPTSDFELLDNGQRLAYDAKTQSGGRAGVFLLVAAPLGLIAVVAGFFAFFGLAVGLGEKTGKGEHVGVGFGALVVVVLCILAIRHLNKWQHQPTIRRIIFDEKSITFDGRTYLLDHVSSIGWRSAGGFSGGGSGWQGTAAMAASQLAYALSGQIYMQYGADEVVIIKSLHPHQVQAVYDKIVGFLERFGRSYRSQ